MQYFWILAKCKIRVFCPLVLIIFQVYFRRLFESLFHNYWFWCIWVNRSDFYKNFKNDHCGVLVHWLSPMSVGNIPYENPLRKTLKKKVFTSKHRPVTFIFFFFWGGGGIFSFDLKITIRRCVKNSQLLRKIQSVIGRGLSSILWKLEVFFLLFVSENATFRFCWGINELEILNDEHHVGSAQDSQIWS